MDAAKIKQFLEARPFIPFKLVMPSDREIKVPHPEFMAISPVGNAAIVWGKGGMDELIDLRWVISLKAKTNGAKRH